MCVLAQGGLTTALFLAALGLTIAFLLMRSSRHFSRQSEARSATVPVGPSPPSPRAHHLGAPEEMTRWEVEMHETARELSAQLDTKMGLLQHLIREADRAAARLDAAVAAAGRAGAETPAVEPQTPRRATTQEPPDRTVQPASQAEALRSASALDPSSRGQGSRDADTPEATAERPSPNRRYQEIYTLADYGYGPVEIAQRVGTPEGEVELILSLRGKR
jgi:hypothetical protein